MDKKSIGVSSFLLGLIFVFLIVAMIGTFYEMNGQKYAIIPIQGSDIIGCLGSCKTSNNNCIGDDATPECTTVQILYIVAAVVVGICFIISVSCDMDSRFTVPFMKKYLSMGGLSVSAMILLFIALILATEMPQGLGDNGPISSIINKDLTNKDSRFGEYKEGFFLTVFSIVFLFFVSILGCSVAS